MVADTYFQVLEALAGVLGQKNVITDDTSLMAAQTATFKTAQRIIGIAKAYTVEDIQKVIKVAREYEIPLYTISIGKNWGYGSRIPPQDNSLLLDLSGMNSILDYDEELGYVTVEPGVTQKQLHDFLEEKGARFIPSTTGSAPDTSVVGNICERGVGASPYCFRAHYTSSLEVVLPSGECVHTGYGRFSNAHASQVYRDGIGPSFIDTFIQSNLGIVTKLTLLLAPTPLYMRLITLSVPEGRDLSRYLDIVRTFSLFSNSKKPMSFHNDLQAIASRTQYPWKLASGKTPLPPAVMEQLKKKYRITYAWKGIIEIQGFTRQEITAQVAHFKSLSKGLEGIEVSSLYRPDMLDRTPGNIGRGTYWRMKDKLPRVKNPDTDGCGSIRASMAVPFTSHHISRVVGMMQQMIPQYGYEPFVEIHCIADRWVLVVASIRFDRTVDGEDEKALRCHDTLLRSLMKEGYYPYRLNVHSMPLVPGSADAYDELQRTIKHAIDPGNIFSPGRYEAWHD